MTTTEVGAPAPAPDRSPPPRRRAWLGGAWWLLPPLVMALLGGWLLAQPRSLWYDELFTAEMAPLPVGRLFDAVVSGEGLLPYLRDAPPSYNGPYYAVAHVWLLVTGLSPDEWGLRLLSVVAAVAAVAVLTRAVGRLAGTGVAVAAGLVAATNPFVVQYAAEARGYSIALLGTALAALGLARWLDGRPRSLLLYGAGVAAAGLAHWFAVPVAAGFAVAAAVLRGRRARPVVAATALGAGPALALVATAVANGVGASGAEWIAGVGLAVPVQLFQSWSGAWTPLVVATGLAGAVGLLWPAAGGRDARVVAAAWVGVPVVAVTAVELVRPVYVDRYLLPALLGLPVLVALAARAWRPVAVVLLGTVLATSLWATAREVRLGPKEDVRGAVAAVARAHRPGEPVVAAARWDALGVDHYTRREHRSLVADVVLPPAPVPAAATVWVVRRSRDGVKGDREKLAALDQELTGRGMQVVEERRFEGRYAGVLVQRWERAPAPT
ncbi:MAG TPA: glycosyltransferase family 39 protein [Acidimicrobiales bacterium]|nr:glycosyltransferase family 39 protein [Acidimicrobiales bacterium]